MTQYFFDPSRSKVSGQTHQTFLDEANLTFTWIQHDVKIRPARELFLDKLFVRYRGGCTNLKTILHGRKNAHKLTKIISQNIEKIVKKVFHK